MNRLLAAIPELKDASQYVREYTGNPIFEISDGKIAVFDDKDKEQYNVEDLKSGRWSLAFTPFAFHTSEWGDLRAYRCLLLYNTAVEEKVLSSPHELDYSSYAVENFSGFNIKTGKKTIKVTGIGEGKNNVQIGEEDENYIEFFLINEKIGNITKLANFTVRDLKARRALSQLWSKYFPDTLISRPGGGPVIIHKVPIDRAQSLGLPVVETEDEMHESKAKYVNIVSLGGVVVALPSYRDFKDIEVNVTDIKRAPDNDAIDDLFLAVYPDFTDSIDDGDYHTYFAKMMNYLYNNELVPGQSLWLDNNGNIYIVKDKRGDDAIGSFIERWDPYDPLNGLLATDTKRFTPI